MTLKTIDSFISTVDPDKATVVSFSEFIAIFGGAVLFKKSRAKPKSYRDAFYRWLLNQRPDLKNLLLFPESYNDWSDFSTYSDLLLFEEDLGYLTSAVLIFLESPGSIAELGAFSRIPSLRKRLMVVVKDIHHPKKSFISLGPIRSIKETNKHPHSVCEIPDEKPDQLEKHIPAIVDMLDQKRKRAYSTEHYDETNHQHEILLILDLINLFSVILRTELLSLVSHFGKKMEMSRLEQILFLLEKTELISSRHYVGVQYYFASKFKKVYVDYTAKSDCQKFKRARFIALVVKEIEKDKNRKIVYDSLKAGGSK